MRTAHLDIVTGVTGRYRVHSGTDNMWLCDYLTTSLRLTHKPSQSAMLLSQITWRKACGGAVWTRGEKISDRGRWPRTRLYRVSDNKLNNKQMLQTKEWKFGLDYVSNHDWEFTLPMCSLDSLLELRHHPRVQLARRHLLDSVQHLDRQVTRAGPDLEDRVCVP